jgi:2'-5' RNA ligase
MTSLEPMRDHWWWRPGWRIGRKMYTWHITFAGQDRLHELVAGYQAVLKPLPGLDLIPARWLHLTMQGVDFTDEVSEHGARGIAAAARERCAGLAPFELAFGRPIVDPESIQFALNPAEPARALRGQIRAAIADVWGEDNVPEAEHWSPHVSIAYSNAVGSPEPFTEALAQVRVPEATLLVSTVELIVLNRDHKMYEWEVFERVALG